MKVLHDQVQAAIGAASAGTRPHAAAIDHRHSSLGVEQLLFTLIDADMNVTTDQTFDKAWDFEKYMISTIRAANASISLTAADGGIYQAAAKAGDPIVAAAQVYTALDATDKALDLTLEAEGKAVLTATPILSLTGPQGAAATADLYIFGYPLSDTDDSVSDVNDLTAGFGA